MILVTGGAGYIGSIIVEQLIRRGEGVVVLDNLTQGHRTAVSDEAIFIKGDIRDKKLLGEMIKKNNITAVVHMAAETVIARSMTEPKSCFHENVVKSLVLLDTMLECDVDKIVFSSSAAVYGEPQEALISEDHPKSPINAYGESKLILEMILKWYHKAYGLKYIAMRYFNAAGASQRLGEDHDPETHLIPLVLQTALGKRKQMEIFGTDYGTTDGSCVRDYIHVIDLAEAHILALNAINKTESGIYNLGNGQGYSVLEVIDAARKITGREIPAIESKRRPGDPAVLIASAKRAEESLGWKPKRNLEAIIESAWIWQKKHPEGYIGC